jgi:hypothetical protein
MSAIPYDAPYGWDVIECPSIPSVSSSTVLGGNNIRFSIEQGSELYVYNGKNSTIGLQLQIVMVDENGDQRTLQPIINTGTREEPTCISIPHLCPNPAGAIIDTAKAVLKGVEFNNIQYASTASTMYRMLYESKLEQDTTASLSAIKPMSQDDQETDIGVIYDGYKKLAGIVGVDDDDPTAEPATYATTEFGKLFSRRMIWALKNQMYNFDRHMTNRLHLQIPLPFFFCDELIHLGTGEKLDVILGISSNWYRNLIQCVGSFASELIGTAPGYGEYKVTNKNSNFENNTINVSVTDMKLYLARGYITSTYVPRSVRTTYYMKSFSPSVANLALTSTTTVTGTFDAIGKITHVIIGFNVKSDFPKYSTTDFSCGFSQRTLTQMDADGLSEAKNTTDGVSMIRQIQLKLGQSIYPQETYTININEANGTDVSNTNDLFRCYQDFCTMTDALRTPVGSLMSYSQWMCNKLFVFKTHQSMNDTSKVYSVKVDLNGTLATPTDIYILGLYDNYLTLEYDDQSRLRSMLPSPAVPLLE